MSNVKVETSKQSFWTQKNNNAKYGFFPTSLEIVKMEMDLIDFSQVSSDVVIPIADFTGGEGEQLHCMHDYLLNARLSPISYYNEITEARYEVAKERYGDIDNFHLLNTDFFRMRLRHKENKSYSKSCIAVIRDNPPYIWMEHNGKKVRSEKVFFEYNSYYNITGGIHILEIPDYQLIEHDSILKMITYRYEQVNIFKFPIEEYNKFKQIVIIGVKKKSNSADIEIAEQWLEKIKKGNIPYLNEVTGPIYTLEDITLKKAKEVNVFRDGKVDSITLTKGLDVILNELMRAEKQSTTMSLDVVNETPIIEKLPGHIASELASGKYNGIMGNCLIRGGSIKSVETRVEEEDGKTVTTETEVIKPFIEITNKEGNIIYKDY